MRLTESEPSRGEEVMLVQPAVERYSSKPAGVSRAEATPVTDAGESASQVEAMPTAAVAAAIVEGERGAPVGGEEGVEGLTE